MEAKSTGKKAMTVGVLDHIFFADAGGMEVAAHTFNPLIQIFLGVWAGDGFAGSARRRMDSDYILQGHGAQAKRIIVSQIRFDGKRKFGHIFKAFDVFG